MFGCYGCVVFRAIRGPRTSADGPEQRGERVGILVGGDIQEISPPRAVASTVCACRHLAAALYLYTLYKFLSTAFESFIHNLNAVAVIPVNGNRGYKAGGCR